MKSALIGCAALAALLAASPARAADLPVPAYKAQPAAIASNGLYVWADGAWEDVHLPSVALSWHNAAFTFLDNGPVDTIRARVQGAGVRGAVGYLLPQGGYSSSWGSNLRFEIGARYVNASGTQNDALSPAGPFINQVLLNGNFSGGFGCVGVITCSIAAGLHTDYRTWELSGKLASDLQAGGVKLTPSLAVFGGEGRNAQSLTQAFSQLTGGALINTGSYNASTALNWTDIGARVGLDASLPLNSWLSFGAGGYVGLAHRSVSLFGSDFGTATSPAIFDGTSVIAVSTGTNVFVANVEAGLNINPWERRDVTFRIFGGADFDNRVPGLSPANYSGTFGGGGFTLTSTTPVGIAFFSETNVYAGGGVMVRFP